jgi:exopolysaccharide biosynthesis polyprenyl glycosylphosphotransferase
MRFGKNPQRSGRDVTGVAHVDGSELRASDAVDSPAASPNPYVLQTRPGRMTGLSGIASPLVSAYSGIRDRRRHVAFGEGDFWERGSSVGVQQTLKGADGQAAGAVAVDTPSVTLLEARRAERARDRTPAGRGGELRRRALLAADVTGLLVACALVSFVVAEMNATAFAGAVAAALLLAASNVLLWCGVTAVAGLYRREEQRADLTVTDDVVPVVMNVSITQWAMLVTTTVTGAHVPAKVLIALWLTAVCFVLVGRTVARTLVRRQPQYVQNTVIVGAGDVGQLLGRKLTHHPELGLRLIGFVDDEPKSMRRDLVEVPVLGTPGELRELVRDYRIQRIIVAFSNESHRTELELVHGLRNLDVQIDVVPRLFEAIGPSVGVHYIEGLPLVALSPVRQMSLARVTKRLIDVVGATVFLALLSPIFLYIAVRVKRGSPGPIFFRQERLGQNMEPFELLKFRTMRTDTDDAPHREYVRSIMDTLEAPNHDNLYKLDRSDAVTEVGVWLRRTSLDELPQLINVLRGEMSLVGPRPCLPYESELCEPQHFDRFLVPAGMTGLWQVTARARSTFREMLDLDAAYARDWSLGLDLKLMLRTPFVIFGARGTA